MRRVFVCLVAIGALLGVVGPAVAAPGDVPLVVDFAQCEEHVGIELVDADLVADEVPGEFGLGFFGPPVPRAASLIVRTATCDQTVIDGVDHGRVTTSQVGVITAVTDADDAVPGPTNGIDNYTLFFVTDSWDFDRALSAAGVKIDHDHQLTLGIDRDTASQMATVTASVHRQPRYELAGTQSDALVRFGAFMADWWTDRGNDRIRMRTSFPDISFGFGGKEAAGTVTLTTGNGSRLARLVDTDQIVFDTSLRGSFPSATLVVEPAQIGDD